MTYLFLSLTEYNPWLRFLTARGYSQFSFANHTKNRDNEKSTIQLLFLDASLNPHYLIASRIDVISVPHSVLLGLFHARNFRPLVTEVPCPIASHN
jgi:hypothetical protein